MENELVSIIIPNYNNERFIGACLKSVQSQTYRNWEAIVVDDGSTDNSYDICQNLASEDDRIKVIKQKNMRVGAARNRGLEDAKGQYIMFLDSDDLLEPDTIETAYEVLNRTDSDMVQWEARMFTDVPGEPGNHRREGKRVDKFGKSMTPHCEIVANRYESILTLLDSRNRGRDSRFAMLWNSCRCVWTKFSKASIFAELRFPENLEYEDDYIVHQMFWNAKKTVFINDELTNKRNHPNSVLHTMSWKGYFDHLETSSNRLAFCYQENLSKECIRYALHDHGVSLLNLDLMVKRENVDAAMHDELMTRIRDLYYKCKNDMFLIDRIVFWNFVRFPDLSMKIYDRYRRWK